MINQWRQACADHLPSFRPQSCLNHGLCLQVQLRQLPARERHVHRLREGAAQLPGVQVKRWAAHRCSGSRVWGAALDHTPPFALHAACHACSGAVTCMPLQ